MEWRFSWFVGVVLFHTYNSCKIVSALALHQPYNIGITSLCANPSHGSIWAGTKRGSLAEITFSSMATFEIQDISSHNADPSLPQSSSHYPIFSLCANSNDSTLFCGGGDRYVSIWSKTKSSSVWTLTQRLGPHTGWVKDVVLDSKHNLLYSIGCNCIETWKQRSTYQNHEDEEWTHFRKTEVDSSPQEGCTLSSDLLGLTLLPSNCLAAGGVDGRVHIWNALGIPVVSFAAHTGRVTALTYANDLEALLTASHDSKLRLWQYKNDDDGGQWTCRLECALEHSPDLRITALCYVKGTAVVGTQQGSIHWVHLLPLLSSQSSTKNPQEMSCFGKEAVALDGGSVVNAICPIPAEFSRGPLDILVGHSNGLDRLLLSSKES